MTYNHELFKNGEDTPLFSGVSQRVREKPFSPKAENKQLTFFTCEKCKDSKTLTIKKKTFTCPYCQS